ncbi:MAG: hypothetical protein R2828_03885 [Saprospiraceae bacterium]
MERTIKIRVVRETNSNVTVHFISLNRKMPIPKKDFEKRVANGVYEVIGENRD